MLINTFILIITYDNLYISLYNSNYKLIYLNIIESGNNNNNLNL